jgi:hypothetical protein
MTKRRGPRYTIEELREALDGFSLSAADIVAGYIELATDRNIEPRDRMQALDRLARLGFGMDPTARQTMLSVTESTKQEVDAMSEKQLRAEAEAILARGRALSADVIDIAVDAELEGIDDDH